MRPLSHRSPSAGRSPFSRPHCPAFFRISSWDFFKFSPRLASISSKIHCTTAAVLLPARQSGQCEPLNRLIDTAGGSAAIGLSRSIQELRWEAMALTCPLLQSHSGGCEAFSAQAQPAKYQVSARKTSNQVATALRQKVRGLNAPRRRQGELSIKTVPCCRAEASANGASRPEYVSVVLLAGGSGKRMGAAIPKQYLELAGQPIAMYSLQVFGRMPEVFEIIVVCDPTYRNLFRQYHELLQRKPSLLFAEPGTERQDSVNNGFKAVDRQQAELVAIHDSARPLITPEDARKCIEDALEVGAAVLGVPVKPTIKEVDRSHTVIRTLNRANLWEVQTPQVIRPDLLQAGFELVQRENLEVTDDVSIIEALDEPVRLTKGSYTNIKVTTPDDMIVAEGFLSERGAAVDVAAIKSADKQ